MRSLVFFCLSLCLISSGTSITFRKVIDIPDNAGWVKASAFDTDHDGKQNLIFDTNVPNYRVITIWEYDNYDRYFCEDSVTYPLDGGIAVFGVGYLDTDSLVDMVGNNNGCWPYPIYVFESPTYYSNPINIVWQDSMFENIGGSYITDLDQDGLKEILFGYTPIGTVEWRTCVYENIGDNQYSLVWQDTVYAGNYFVYGDFDLDNKLEFITTLSGGQVICVWEFVGDNCYTLTFCDTVYYRGPDIFSTRDMDSNGKPEFLITFVSELYGTASLYLYEAIGDNNYDYLLVDSVAGLPLNVVFQLSCGGDVDSDGKDEIIWSTCNQWHIYKATGVHQYHKIYSSAWTTHDATVMSVYDLNKNGYPEIIESWIEMYNLGTNIWEIEGVRLHKPNGGETLHPNQQYAITWQKFDPPGADSFALFFSFDNGNTYDTIALGIPGSDTTYQWIVPNVISDSCKIMIWAYGPPRPGEDVPRGIAWDFSDSVFTINDEGIETHNRYQITDYSLKISQNPVSSNNLKIQYSIPRPSKVKLVMYNVLGQLEQVLIDKEIAPSIYEIGSKNPLTDGVYFVKLTVNKKTITKKCVILKD